MIKMQKLSKKLKVARETLLALSAHKLEEVHGGVVTIAGGWCEPSGIRPCPGG